MKEQYPVLLKNQRIFITVKTYPTLSNKYGELVCTAGITESGKWLRIYPIRYRNLQEFEQYRKYQWISFNLIKNEKDSREESYRPSDQDEKPILQNCINTSDNWLERRKLIDKTTIYKDFTFLEEDRSNCPSLITFKPAKILDFYWKESEREWTEKQKSYYSQLDIFEKKPELINLRKLPYDFYYHFEDGNHKFHRLKIEDWETGMLFWHCLEYANYREDKALQLVRKKYWDNFVHNKDILFFLGTTKRHHYTSRNPFLIIGLFTPPKVNTEQIQIEF